MNEINDAYVYNVMFEVLKEIPDPLGRQPKEWIFPTRPQSLQQKFPKLAILVDNVGLRDFGNGFGLIEEKEDINGAVVEFDYALRKVYSVRIGCYIKKSDKTYDCELYDGTIVKMRNLRFLDWLVDRVVKKLVEKREYIESTLGQLTITGVSNSFQEMDNLWAKMVGLQIAVVDIVEVANTYDNIDAYTLNVDVG